MTRQQVWIGVALLGFVPSAFGDGEAPLLAVKRGWLIDGTGAPPSRNIVVVIEGKRIKQITQGVPAGPDRLPHSRHDASGEGLAIPVDAGVGSLCGTAGHDVCT